MCALETVPVFILPSTSGRVLATAKFEGRTRTEWFTAVRQWLLEDRAEIDDVPSDQSLQVVSGSAGDARAFAIAADIVRKFESEKRAPYLNGKGYLRYGGRSGVHVIVYRRHNNPHPWTVPLEALREAVSQSCAAGRPLRSKECNAVRNRLGTPLSILLRLVPDGRYRM